MDYVCVTNNPKVRDSHQDAHYAIRYIETDYRGILSKARDLIHVGFVLETHPLAGSVKPGETPYKTILLARRDKLDLDSLRIIEEALAMAAKLWRNLESLPDNVKNDLQLIDYSLIFGRA